LLFVVFELVSKLFETFGFERSMLIGCNRQLQEPIFFHHLKKLINSPENEKYINEGSKINEDFYLYCCNLFKNYKDFICFNILKKKISNNLKNFKDLTFTMTVKKKLDKLFN